MTKTGKISSHPDGYQVRFERLLPFNTETVWNAITDPQKLAIWFTDITMDFREGGEITIWFRDAAKTKSNGKIIRIVKPKLFQYTWEEELATWELFPQGADACKLVLTYSKVPDEYATHVPAGWHMLLDQLETVLAGRKEPYAFGGEETPEARLMKAFYTDLITKEFPQLKSNP